MSSRTGVELSVEAGALAPAVVGEVISYTAMAAELPLDRLNDLLMVSDQVLAEAFNLVADERVSVVIDYSPRAVGLEIGPFSEGVAKEALDSALPIAGKIVEQLADRGEVISNGDGSERIRVEVNAGKSQVPA